jgi:hypothetical protein
MAKQDLVNPLIRREIDAANAERFGRGTRGDEATDPLKAAIERAIPTRVSTEVDPQTGIRHQVHKKNER